MTKTCVICGAKFTPKHRLHVCCSAACSYKRKKEQDHRYRLEHPEEYRAYEKAHYQRRKAQNSERRKKRTLDETVAAADAAGLSYGEYVIKQMLERQNGRRV